MSSTASGGAGGASGESGSSSDEPMRGAFALHLSETTCVDQTTWLLPSSSTPVSDTERGSLATNEAFETVRVHCLVHQAPDGTWDIEAAISLNSAATLININTVFDPEVVSEGGFQLIGPSVRQDISSNEGGPCPYTLFDVSEGNVWGKVDCAVTRERDLSECGAATVHFVFENCFTDRREYQPG